MILKIQLKSLTSIQELQFYNNEIWIEFRLHSFPHHKKINIINKNN